MKALDHKLPWGRPNTAVMYSRICRAQTCILYIFCEVYVYLLFQFHSSISRTTDLNEMAKTISMPLP